MKLTPDKRAEWLKSTLQIALSPTQLDIIDQGWQHVGHAEEGAGHFKVVIASPHFKGKSLIECHKLVYRALGNAVGDTIHALQIEIHS